MDSRKDIIQITLIIIRPPQIPKNRLQTRKLRLKRLREAKLRNLNIRHRREQILRDLPQKPANALGCVIQPARSWVGRRTRREAIWRRLRGAGAFGEAWGGRVADAGVEVFDAVGVVGGVGVDGEEVAGAFDEVFFGLGEGWEEGAEGVFEGLGVVAVVPLGGYGQLTCDGRR